MQTTLYTLFMPPEDCIGDFGFITGFTATKQVLDQIKRTFSGEVARPALAAFIHPTIDAQSDIPGLAWMWMRLEKRGYNLLHAKVALLGFRKREGRGYVIRLVVSTGNWTQDPLTDSIDLFWSIDVDLAQPSDQDCSDVQAAWKMFSWLRRRADCSLIEQEYDGHRPDSLLADAVALLPKTDLAPRFVDSRTQPLLSQVTERVSGLTKANRLIVGSGYFEAAGDGDAGLLERLREAFVKDKALTKNATLDLFLNPLSCQGIAERATALTGRGWALRRAFSEKHGEDGKLHAKFVLVAKLNANEEVKGKLYLGSGNLSRVGFETAASSGGNLEAGVVIDLPDNATWRGKAGISIMLPLQFENTVTLKALRPGDDFVSPEEPTEQPPVSWLVWRDGVLMGPDGAEIDVVDAGNQVVCTPCEWPGPPPSIVTLAHGGWRLPVIAEGVLVVPRRSELTVEDILAGLATFPEPQEIDRPDDAPEGEEPIVTDQPSAGAPESAYAIRRMMHLLVKISEAQKRVDQRDWQRWCRELRGNLSDIVKTEHAMLEFFRSAGADPLSILADPRMRPPRTQDTILRAALADVKQVWGLASCPSLWDREADHK
ncbi:hypothetical protein SAMN05428969_1051 [Devosia sp. YR412]|uniref:hypothetical protein n=1 Tax=Devosia sp. YR412 TaxID=1881030 RepID=UPI0008AF0EAF|nr:hypothetical protein [Devosia sp. YR412]SEP82000.1 hypothetical protein SAMN05428969_1051 [Devosia sp. YR412]